MRRPGWTLVLALVASFAVSACSGGTTEDTEPPAEGVVLRVVVDGKVAVDWTLADLEADVPFVDLVIDGDEQNGPLLTAVLAASGVSEWESGEVIGMGEGRIFAVGLDISVAEINDGWIFDVTNKGSLKLASADLPREQWVRDVGEIAFP